MKFGLNFKLRHDPTWKRLESGALAPSVLVAVPVKDIGSQLVGLNMNPGRSITALIVRRSDGTPSTIVRQRVGRDRQLRGVRVDFDLRARDDPCPG